MAEEEPTTKERLLSSAVELMAAHGSIDSVSLRAVAGATGVSPTAVYRHFADRDALVVAALEWAWAEFDRALRKASDDLVDPHDRLQAQGFAYVELALASTGVYTVLFGHPDAQLVMRTEVGFDVFDNLVAIVGGVLDANGDPRSHHEVAVYLFTSIHGIAHLRSVQPHFPWPPLEQQLTQLLVQLRLERP